MRTPMGRKQSMVTGEESTASANDLVDPEAVLLRYPVPALDKGLDILECLAGCSQGLNLSELAARVNRKASEIFRVVDCFKRRGYITHHEQSDKLMLTMRLFELAHSFPPTDRLVAAALPVMEQLALAAGQSCHLAVFSAGQMLVIAQVDAPQAMGFAVRVGARVGLLTSSSGRVFLSCRPEAQCARLAGPALAGLGPADNERVKVTLARIREQGHESVASDLIQGITNMSFPVCSVRGDALASLTIPFLQWDAGGERATRQDALALLRDAASKISARLGFANGNGSDHGHQTWTGRQS